MSKLIKRDKRRMSSWYARAMVLGLALTARAGAPPGRYSLSTDTVFDTQTGLTWERNAQTTTYSLEKASTHCQTSSLGGMTGWRLPTIKELQSLVDIRALDPAIDTVAFPSTPSIAFWSSSLNANNISYAWVVNFYFGATNTDNLTANNQVRCVR